MLAIRLQRLGRQGYPVYRLAVQEAQRHPSSGRVVAYVGVYNPHTKEVSIQKEAAQKYLDNGAQPTPRVVKLLKESGVKLPSWVKEFDTTKAKVVKKAEKLRKNQPKQEPDEEPKTDNSKEQAVETNESPAAVETDTTSGEEVAEEKTEAPVDSAEADK